MKKLFFLLLFIAPLTLLGQGEGNKYIREGNKLYENGKFAEASAKYDEALIEDTESFEGAFNLGDALYRQEKFEEAASLFEVLANQEATKENIAKAYYNLGNSYMKTNKVKDAVKAYKKSLMNNPNDYDTKYNLSHAQRLMKKQEEEKKDQEKDEDKKDDEKKDDDEDKDGEKDEDKDGDKEKDDKDKGDKDDEKKDDGDEKKDDKGDEDKKDQPKPQQRDGVSKEDATKLLEALKNDEEKLQKELMKQKVKGQPVQIQKPW